MCSTKKFFARLGLLGRLQPFQCSDYEGYFSATDAAFRNGRVASTQKGRKTCWKILCYFVRPLGLETWLQDATCQQRVWFLTGFAACVISGRYVRGETVSIGTVSGFLSAIGTTVVFAYEGNPTKVQGENI